MSLQQFFNIIDKSAIGRYIDRKLNVFKNVNPHKIYVENIRAFYNLPYGVAKFFCRIAVTEGFFIKKIGVICPNKACERIILEVNTYEEIPEVIICENCEALEREHFEFSRTEIRTVEYYQINPLLTDGQLTDN